MISHHGFRLNVGISVCAAMIFGYLAVVASSTSMFVGAIIATVASIYVAMYYYMKYRDPMFSLRQLMSPKTSRDLLRHAICLTIVGAGILAVDAYCLWVARYSFQLDGLAYAYAALSGVLALATAVHFWLEFRRVRRDERALHSRIVRTAWMAQLPAKRP